MHLEVPLLDSAPGEAEDLPQPHAGRCRDEIDREVPLVLPWLVEEGLGLIEAQDAPLGLRASNRRDLRQRLDDLLAQGRFQDELQGRKDVIHRARGEPLGAEVHSELLDLVRIDVFGLQFTEGRDEVVVEVGLLVVGVALSDLLAPEAEGFDVSPVPSEKVLGEGCKGHGLFGDHLPVGEVVDGPGFGSGFRALPRRFRRSQAAIVEAEANVVANPPRSELPLPERIGLFRHNHPHFLQKRWINLCYILCYTPSTRQNA